jgi:hypothetical protein
MMFSFFKKYRERVAAQAGEFMETFGDKAYFVARKAMRAARERGDREEEKFLARVSVILAKRIDHDIGLDTATRLLESRVPYDPGPGLVIRHSEDDTLH